jgi:hypothetical protein
MVVRMSGARRLALFRRRPVLSLFATGSLEAAERSGDSARGSGQDKDRCYANAKLGARSDARRGGLLAEA